MTEPTEPTREQIEKRIAQLEALVRFPQYAAIWDTDLAVYRMALRTLDAEAQLAAMTERAELAETLLGASNAAVDALRATTSAIGADARAIRDAAMTHAGEFMHAGETAAPAIERMATALREATERAEKAERERHVAVSVMREMRVAWDGASDQRNDLRAKLAEVELERDEDRKALGEVSVLLAHATDRLTEVERERDEAVSVMREMRVAWDAASAQRDDLRAKLADAERRIAEVGRELLIKDAQIAEMRRALGEQHAKLAAMHRRAQLAENPTTHTRCEATFQRKRADWWRDQAKRLGWTPDYPELREEQTSDARLDCESSSLLLLSTWARRVMMRPKNRAKGVPSESVEELIVMARKELTEARDAIEENAPTDDILAELGDAAAIIGFAMREIEKRRKA